MPRATIPVVDPHETITSMTNRVSAVPLRDTGWRWWWIALAPSVALLGLGLAGVAWAFLRGIRVWGNDWPVMWGFPILAYVWWIAIASGGTFVSAFFFLVRVEWRTSVNRIAETMTLFAALAAGVYPILHLGRPYFAYWLFPYPNTMTLWPQWKSPLLWDFMALLTYVVASVLFWYLGLMPDLATMRDRARSRLGQVGYGIFAMGFRGSGPQWRHLKATYGTLAAIMAPLVVSVHSVVGLDFAGGATPGWHSTEYPPFFVFGALWSGLSSVTLILLALRGPLGLATLVTERHIRVLAQLMLTSSLCMSYAYVQDAFEPFYSGEATERMQFLSRIAGADAPVYWGMIFCNCLFPLVLCVRRMRHSHAAIAVVAMASIVGMWLERFNIVAVSLRRTHLPSAWGTYTPTFWDWAVFGGTIGLFLTGFLLAVRLVPMVSMFEMRELLATKGQGGMILAMFAEQDALQRALHQLRSAQIGPLETYSPAPLQDAPEASPIPVVILLAGLLGAVASFALQSYSSILAYPFDIGGRPAFAWPSFIPTAFENAVLVAVVAGFVGFLVVNRLPRLHDPVDEWDAMRRASRDRWFLQVASEDPAMLARARALLDRLHPLRVETLPG